VAVSCNDPVAGNVIIVLIPGGGGVKGCSCQGTSIDALHELGNTQQHWVGEGTETWYCRDDLML
jgi:hypothetical protein